MATSRSGDLAIKALKDLISSGVICKGKMLKATSQAICSARRYKSESKGAAVLPNDLASSADFPVASQNQEELVSADAPIRLPGCAELCTGFGNVIEPASHRPGAIDGNHGTIDLTTEANTFIGSLVARRHIETAGVFIHWKFVRNVMQFLNTGIASLVC